MKNALLFIWYLLRPILVFLLSPVWLPALIVLAITSYCLLLIFYWVAAAKLRVEIAQAETPQEKHRLRMKLHALSFDYGI